MAQGLALPVRTNRRGQARLIAGSDHLAQLILEGMTPCTSRNPFQRGGGVEIGISEAVVFGLNNVLSEAQARRGINRLFRRLRDSGLARLLAGGGVKFDRSGGDLEADVSYFDLEADDEKTVSANLSTGLRSAPATPGG